MWYIAPLYMAGHKINDEVEEALRKRRDEIEQGLRAAQDRKPRNEQRLNEKRRLLAGSVVVEFTDANPDDYFTRRFLELLDRHITRTHDRACSLPSPKCKPLLLTTRKPDTAIR
jgi:hypothetical protein